MPEPDRRSERAAPIEEISRQEARSFTHGDFWIPEAARETYKRALRALNGAGVPYIVAGAYAIYEHTGIYRETKDLDVFVEPRHVVPSMRALKDAGFTARLEQPHWLAKALDGEHFVDIIYGMGNGLATIGPEWYRYSRPAILAATPVRVAPAEELVWHRLFIHERHRQDMADIVHLIVSVGCAMNWRRLLDTVADHWHLLLAQLEMFCYVYPESVGCVPAWVMEELLERARRDLERPRSGERVTRGTMLSRFSFAIDVNEWGLRDLREEFVRQLADHPEIRAIAASDVWDEMSKESQEYANRAE